jgi:hypothetical protein
LKPARRTFTAIKIAERPRERKGWGSTLHDADGSDLGHQATDPQFVGDPDHFIDILISGGGVSATSVNFRCQMILSTAA